MLRRNSPGQAFDGIGLRAAAARYIEDVMNKHLFPREHGAYAELGFPLLSGLVLGSPGLASALFAAAAILLFLANEPLVVLLGARGKRLQQELAVPARRQLAMLGGLGVAAGLAAMALAPTAARWLALVPCVLAAGLVPVVLSQNLKTLPGEFVAGAAFSAMHLPVAAAGGVAGVAPLGPAASCGSWSPRRPRSRSMPSSRASRGRRPGSVPRRPGPARLALLGALAAWVWVPGLAHGRPGRLRARWRAWSW